MFDYIIVGAGSAGCVLANRLTEDPAVNVLLIEAGKTDKKREIHIPAAFSRLFKTEYDWDYTTVAQAAANNRKLYLPRGKVLGGSSSINAMIYIRGHQRDYDHWASLGNKGWGYADMLPYFKKSEDQVRGEDEYHGTGGLQSVVDPQEPHSISSAWAEAAGQAGYQINTDFNGAMQEGFGLYQLIQKNGKRVSAAKAFLKPALSRPNLKVMTEVEVLALEMEGKRITGVQARLDTHIQVYGARQAVIVSAGAYNSPQLLLRSGIGPGADLQAIGRKVRHDLSGVGQHLQDHLIVPMVFDNKDKETLEQAETAASLTHYLVWGEGPLSSNVAEAGGFVRTLPELEAPDIQFHFAPGFFMRHGFRLPKKGYGFSFGPTLLQPESAGAVSLNPNDIEGDPLIDHR
ncbi:MAG: GMC family oxidoreductase N-terminal domain-containing protein, partial [Bacteroidota bacterium]